jgi:acetyl esterase/lipase
VQNSTRNTLVVPVGYLITVAILGAGTAFALAPPRRPRVLARLAFVVGGAVNEMPYYAGLLLCFSTALAFAEGDVGSTPAWVAVGVAALTICGLAVVAWRGARTAVATERALREGLGPGWRAAVGTSERSRRAALLRWARIVLVPWPLRPGGVERVKNLAYGDAGKRNRLDVYRHRSHPSRSPILVYLHGGGYFSGGKNREARPLLHRLAGRGWTCIAANYRLRPEVSFPDHLVDAKRAIAWAREHAEEFGGDPERVFVAGSSAGGHLAAFAALTPNDASFQPGFEAADTSVSAAICLYGYLGNYYGQGEESSPQTHVHAAAPPFLIAQGDRDTYSPRFLAIARAFAAELRRTSANPVVYAELPGGQHAFDLFRSARFEAVVDAIEEFTRWVSAKQDGSQPPRLSD